LIIIVDILALLILLYYFFRGYRRGFVISVLGIIGLICASLGAYLLFRPLGDWFQATYNLSPVVSYAIAAISAFIVIYVFFFIISGFISWRRRARAKREGEPEVAFADKLLGGILGAVIGFILIVVLVWVYNMVQFSVFSGKLPDINSTVSGRSAEAAIRAGTNLMAKKMTRDPEMSQTIARTMTNPARTAVDMQKLLNHPKVEALADDQEFLGAVLKGDEAIILKTPAFNEMLDDPEVMRIATDLGLMSPGEKPEAIKKEAAARLAKVGRNFDKIKNDPEVQEILQDKEIQEKIDKEDVQGLLTDPKFHRLLKRALEISGN
jgi:uncharacterized membrane protein required for colicin V production